MSQEKIVIVGAGLSGATMAIFLARRGYKVVVYERRHDLRQHQLEEGKSINLGLSARGIKTLTAVGLIDQVMADAVVMRGRVIHGLDSSLVFQPYGKDEHEVLHSIERNELNLNLIALADSHENVTFHFEKQCVALDKQQRTLTVEDVQTGASETVEADVIIGADGAFSKVRQEMHYRERANYEQEFLDWGYKELTLPADANGRSLIEHQALHLWPRENALIVSHANRDGSHTITLFLPFVGEPYSFEKLQTADAVHTFFQQLFPDLVPLMPDLTEEFLSNPVGQLVTVQTAPWHYENWVTLIGDACHAVYPFYGQGMNASLEDCLVLDSCIEQYKGDWQAVFHAFQTQRKPHTDTLAMLSKQNFVELNSKVASPWFIALKKLNISLNKLFPEQWLPIYTMVSHSTIPYAEALERAQRQDKLLTRGAMALGVGTLWMANKVRKQLSPKQ